MPDTPHIRRFEEWFDAATTPERRLEEGTKATRAMLNDLAEHIERLERIVGRLDRRVEMYRTDLIQLICAKTDTAHGVEPGPEAPAGGTDGPQAGNADRGHPQGS